MLKAPRAAPKRTDAVVMRGGLDVSTPSHQIDPGKLTTALNYEVNPGNGYRRIDGIERFDGRPKPSNARYDIIWGPFSGVAVGDAVNGQTSSATAVVIAAYPTAVDLHAVIVTKVVGTFAVGENLRVGTTVVGVISTPPPSFQLDPWLDLDWRYLAAEEYRKDILRPPGSGPVRGVFSLGGQVYCIRNNASGTEGVMYRATSTGWTSVPLGFSLRYTLGNTGVPIAVGNTVVGGTSGASGVVTKVTVESGDDGFSAGDPASGQLIFSSISGTFTSGEELRVSGVRRADADGTQSANVLPVDGRYETITHNFYGDAASKAVYGVNGVGKAFEFNGSVFCFIESTLSAPVHVEAHAASLVLSQASTIVMSRPGVPVSFDGTVGAVSIAVGGNVTGMLRVPGSAEANATVVATNDNGVFVLYGQDASNLQLVPVSPERRIARYSLAAIGTPIGLDKSGLTQVLQTSAFGNFAFSSISTEYNRVLLPLYAGATASVIVPSKNQYRIFFSNGSGIAVTMVGSKPIGALPFNYEGRSVFCAHLSDIDSESVFVGAANGYVYQLDRGTSLDGDPIISWMKTAPNYSGNYMARKRYFGCSFEVTPTSAFTAKVSPRLSLDRGDNDEHALLQIETLGQGALWDDAFWDQFYWDSGGSSNYSIDLNGSGNCIAFVISNDSAKMSPWVIESYSLKYQVRREER